MRIFRQFKRELQCTDLRICLLCILISWVLCGLTLWLSGGGIAYRRLCGECSAPPPGMWLILRQLAAILTGSAVGIMVGRMGCAFRGGGWRGIGWWLSGFLAMLIWQFLLLSVSAEFAALLLLLWSILSFLMALKSFARESLLSALLLLCGVLWMMGSFGLILRIILWN